MNNCTNCNIEFEGRTDAKFCSSKCRKEAFNKRSVSVPVGTDKRSDGTDNVVFAERIIPESFEFYTISKANGTGRKQDEKSEIRKAIYWYDVPIAAIPVIKKGNPEMPEFMNGRQYFLWAKNEFKTQDKKGNAGYGMPEIFNPFPSTEGAVYVKAGEGSRLWGTA